jgi:hypothetical protein
MFNNSYGNCMVNESMLDFLYMLRAIIIYQMQTIKFLWLTFVT